MEKKQVKQHSLKDYFQAENVAEGKNEFHEGKVIYMAGGTINHSRITTNLLCALNPRLQQKDKGCEAYNSDLRVFIKKTNSVVYPDLSVICGSPQTHKHDSETVSNPIIIVEVLSKTTETYDRGNKFFKYRQLPTLREYILVSQNRICIESFLKKDEGDWPKRTFKEEDEFLYIATLDVKIPLLEIYRNVRNLRTQALT